MKPIIITGGTGLIGSAILRELLSDNRKVIMASSSTELKSLDPLLTIVPYSLTETKLNDELTSALQDCAGIIHCSAIRPTNKKPVEISGLFGDNIAGTATLMTAAVEFKVPSFIFLSGVNLFPSNIILLDESTQPHPEDLYLLAKWVGEQTANLLDSKSETSFLNLRVSAPYGPNWNSKAVIPLFLEKALKNEAITLLGSGLREQVFTYVDDIAKAAMVSMGKRLSGTYNVAGNQTVNMRQLATIILDAVPNTQSKVIFTGKPDPNEDQKRVVPISKIKNRCGWEPSFSLIKGIKKMVQEIQSPSPKLYSSV